MPATHDRSSSHLGTEDSTTTVLASAIGRYTAGTSLHDMLVDLDARLSFAEQTVGSGKRIHSFSVNAHIIDPGSFTIDAFLRRGGLETFTIDALITGTFGAAFTIDALILEEPVCD